MYIGDTRTIAGVSMSTAVLRQLAGWMAGNFRMWISTYVIRSSFHGSTCAWRYATSWTRTPMCISMPSAG
jgi:hypothetical protein